MAFESLTTDEKSVVRQCVSAICYGPHIDDDEFQTRIGVTREQGEAMLSLWPQWDDSGEFSVAAMLINNCMNETCHGISIPLNEWNFWFDVSKEEILKVLLKWNTLKGKSFSGII